MPDYKCKSRAQMMREQIVDIDAGYSIANQRFS